MRNKFAKRSKVLYWLADNVLLPAGAKARLPNRTTDAVFLYGLGFAALVSLWPLAYGVVKLFRVS